MSLTRRFANVSHLAFFSNRVMDRMRMAHQSVMARDALANTLEIRRKITKTTLAVSSPDSSFNFSLLSTTTASLPHNQLKFHSRLQHPDWSIRMIHMQGIDYGISLPPDQVAKRSGVAV